MFQSKIKIQENSLRPWPVNYCTIGALWDNIRRTKLRRNCTSSTKQIKSHRARYPKVEEAIVARPKRIHHPRPCPREGIGAESRSLNCSIARAIWCSKVGTRDLVPRRGHTVLHPEHLVESTSALSCFCPRPRFLSPSQSSQASLSSRVTSCGV